MKKHQATVLTNELGTGIAPFFPIPTTPSGSALPFHIFLFIIRVPLLIFFMLAYFVVFAWLPIGSLGRKAALWCILGIPGIWWVDLQIDGVKKGYELKQFLGHHLSSNHAQPLQLSHIQDHPRPTSSYLFNHRRFVHFSTRQHLPRRNL